MCAIETRLAYRPIAWAMGLAVCMMVTRSDGGSPEWTVERIGERFPAVAYADPDDGSPIFMLGCTRPLGDTVTARSPAQAKQGGRAVLQIRTDARSVSLDGNLSKDESGTIFFDSDTIEDESVLNKILLMISSGRPITLALDKGQYTIPGSKFRGLDKKYECY
jgi:hypothetical protein